MRWLFCFRADVDVEILPDYDPYIVLSGSTFSLTCNVTDANPSVTSFVWVDRMETTETITIPNADPTDDGPYVCDAINGVMGDNRAHKHVEIHCKYTCWYILRLCYNIEYNTNHLNSDHKTKLDINDHSFHALQ